MPEGPLGEDRHILNPIAMTVCQRTIPRRSDYVACRHGDADQAIWQESLGMSSPAGAATSVEEAPITRLDVRTSSGARAAELTEQAA